MFDGDANYSTLFNDAPGLQIVLARAETLFRRKEFAQALTELKTAVRAAEEDTEEERTFWGARYMDELVNVVKSWAGKDDETHDPGAAKFYRDVLDIFNPKGAGKSMETVENIEELVKNAKTLDSYLSLDEDAEAFKFAKESIFRGKCFVAFESWPDGVKFYPSRFIGYKNNFMEKHQSSFEIDGRETNRAITKLLKTPLLSDGKGADEYGKMELVYKNYCHSLGIEPSKIKRKYWPIIKSPAH